MSCQESRSVTKLKFLKLVHYQVLASAEEQIIKLQTVVANQRNDKEAILDLRNRIFEYDQTNQDAVNEFKKFKVHTQGNINVVLIDTYLVLATRTW